MTVDESAIPGSLKSSETSRGLPELRILIADDHELMRRGVRTFLEAERGWKVVGEARDGQEAVEKAKELRPEIVVLDIGMPRLNGLEAARRINRALPKTKILILTLQDSERMACEVLNTGARGYVTKADTEQDLVSAINALRRGKTFFTSGLDRIILDSFLHGRSPEKKAELCTKQLTSRQFEILQLLAEGKSSKEVCVMLNLSLKTVETHRTNIMKRLSCHSVSELVRYAIRNNVIQT